ncbi:MAG: hypothetical protein ABW210_02170, partial [Achromobacter sp.]
MSARISSHTLAFASPTDSAPTAGLKHSIADRWLETYPTLPLPGRGHTIERWQTLADIAADDLCAA